MGGQARYSDLTGNPEDAKLRIAPWDQVTSGGNVPFPQPPPLASLYVQSDWNGGGPVVGQSEIPDETLDGDEGLAGKRTVVDNPYSAGTVDPENPLQVYGTIGVVGAYRYTDNTTSDKYEVYEGAAANDGGGTAVNRFVVQINNQISQIRRYLGVYFTGDTISASPNGPLTMELQAATERYDEWGAITQTAGSGSTLPKIIGTFDGNRAAEGTDKDIYFKATTDNGSDSWDFQTKITAAAAYSNTQTHTVGNWLRLQDEAGDIIGERRDQPQIWLPSSPTLTAADEFKIERREDTWTDSLGSRYPITSVNIRVFVDPDPTSGSSIPFEVPLTDVTIGRQWETVDVSDHTPSAQGKDIHIGGKLVTTVNFTRRMLDMLFEFGIEDGKKVAFIFDAQSDTEIGSTGLYYRYCRIIPNALVTGETWQVPPGGGGAVNESPSLMAKNNPASYANYDGITVPAGIRDYTLFQNTLADDTNLVAS